MSNKSINNCSSHCELKILRHSPVSPLIFLNLINLFFIKIKFISIFEEKCKPPAVQSSNFKFTLLKSHNSLFGKSIESSLVSFEKDKIIEWIDNLLFITKPSYFINPVILNLYSGLKFCFCQKSTLVGFLKCIQLIIFCIKVLIIYDRTLNLYDISTIITHQTSKNLSQTIFDGVIASML